MSELAVSIPKVVYFSSVSNNTKRFVEKLKNVESVRIPISSKTENPLVMEKPYVLILPTYGGGKPSTGKSGKYVPIQVIKFLNNIVNRNLIKAVIAAGNTNFGSEYAVAGDIVAQKCKVPYLYKFELMGTKEDVKEVEKRLNFFWQEENVNVSA